MGWGFGVINGREVGYAIEAECDYPGCTTTIDRGLGCICGSMHGQVEDGCADYFCETHLYRNDHPKGPCPEVTP